LLIYDGNSTVLFYFTLYLSLQKILKMPINPFDSTITHALNQVVHTSKHFDESVVFLSNCQMLKGGVLMTALWWVWFSEWNNQKEKRIAIISALIGCFVAMFIARIGANILPFRMRPIIDAQNHLREAYGLNRDLFDNLSSFPSDHATLFFGLSLGLWYASKKNGLFALLYTTVFIALPRIYLGLHYTTDILGGAAIGCIMVALANTTFVRQKISATILAMGERKRHIFYPLFFLLSYQIADMFVSTRNIASFVIHLFH
jgi:undecaprenyl-diphosphatase